MKDTIKQFVEKCRLCKLNKHHRQPIEQLEKKQIEGTNLVIENDLGTITTVHKNRAIKL